jgi:L-amino acid N-acyltransferase YncA
MEAADADAVLAFARDLPPHDLLFLPRDITHPKVLDAWVAELQRGTLTSLIALQDGRVAGCATIVCDPLSWSPHVAELRVIVSAGARGKGLGRRLMEQAFALALPLGIEKLVAQMTVDQTVAIATFESMGYRPEALLRDHVKDRDGSTHDIVILSHSVAGVQARAEAYGMAQGVASGDAADDG